jgi:hypothetical protein
MSISNDNKKDDKNDFPVREGQGKASSILSEKDKAGGADSGNSESYPAPTEEDKMHKNQDEYEHTDKEKKNTSV